MKNIYEILKDLGLAIPEDRRSEFDKSWKENYRTKEEYDKAVAKRDEYKKSLDGVQTKLDGFKDVDVDDLKGQISTLTKQLSDEKAARSADAQKVEAERKVDAYLSGKKFVNDITQKALRTSLMEALAQDSAKGKSIEDLFNGLITDKDGKALENILVDEAQQRAQQNQARFTQPAKNQPQPSGAKLSPAQLMRMKNENPNLDIRQYM